MIAKITKHCHNIFLELLNIDSQLLFRKTSVREAAEEKTPRPNRGIVLLLLVGIVIGFVALQLVLRQYEPSLKRDSIDILEQVTVWQQTGEYNMTRNFVPPLALFCFRLPLALRLPLESGCLFLILLLGVSIPVLSFLIARECCPDDRIALVFAALMASNPYLHDIYNSILRDPVFIPLALMSCYLILCNYNRPGILMASAAGIFSALALLTRYEGIVLPVVFAGFMILIALRDRVWKKTVAMTGCFFFCWAAGVLLPLYIWSIQTVAWRVFLWRFSNLQG